MPPPTHPPSPDAPPPKRPDAPAAPAPERRRGPDRRRRPTPWISRYWLTGRRRGARRAEEHAGYVDRYTLGESLLVLGIVLACGVDLYLTLDYLRLGGEEWNPVMAYLLRHGEGVFIATKMGVTCAGLLVLLMRVRFRGMRRALQAILLLYIGLMCWHAAVRHALPNAAGRTELANRAVAERQAHERAAAAQEPAAPEPAPPEPAPAGEPR